MEKRAIRLINESVVEGDCLICLLTPSAVYAYVKNYGPAHRFIWEATYGPIPKGMFICHKCDIPRCINIDHLFIGTPADNMQDKVSKGRQTFGGPGKLLNISQYNQIVLWRYEGLTYEDIGQKLFVSRRTVKRFLEVCPHD